MPILVMVGAGFYCWFQICEALRLRHTEIWRELGSPTLIRNNRITNTFALRRFLKSERFEQIDDALLKSWVRLNGRIEIAYALVFVGVFVFVLASL